MQICQWPHRKVMLIRFWLTVCFISGGKQVFQPKETGRNCKGRKATQVPRDQKATRVLLVQQAHRASRESKD